MRIRSLNRLAICVLGSSLGFCSLASAQGDIITTVAGNGTGGFSGDGGLATSASLFGPYGVAVDGAGNLFIADCYNNRIRKVSGGGIITTIAGSTAGYAGDGGPATLALLWAPCAVALDASGNLFIADQINNVIRKLSASGIITTVAGGGEWLGDGGLATSARLSSPSGVAVDVAGNLFIADSGNNRIRKVSASGIITTVAGSGAGGFSLPGSGFAGDGGPAISALLSQPTGIVADTAGNLFIADSYNNRIRKVSTGGIITTVAGSGAITGYTGGFSGDGGSATSAQLSRPYDVVLDASGNLLISDSLNNRIRKVSASGIITTVAGGGAVLGDGGPATSGILGGPFGIALDASGNLFIADFDDGRIREVSTPASSGSPVAIPLPAAVNTVDVNPNTNQVYVGGNISNVVQNIVWIDGNTNSIVKSLGVGQGLHVNPATNKIYAADLYAGHILVYSGSDGSLLNTIPTFGCPVEAVVDASLNHIWGGGQCGGGNDPAFLIDGSTDTLISGYIGSGGVMGGQWQ
jgi:sugar lactone lactonase YvrE